MELDTIDLAELVRTAPVWACPRLSMTTVVIDRDGHVDEKNVAKLRTRRKQIATWHVFNDSDQDQRVEVTNFRVKATSEPAPDVGGPFSPVEVPAHQSRYIRGVVEGPIEKEPVLYEYDIVVTRAQTGSRLVVEPDYEIWP
jgi:hypothetical protein